MYKQHREKLTSLFEQNRGAAIFIRGKETMFRYTTDYEFPFRQESNFWYLTGANEAGCAMILDLDSGSYHLFVPKRDTDYAVWHGRVKSLEEYQEEYQPDYLHYADELAPVMKKINPKLIYCLDAEQAAFVQEISADYTTDTESLADALTYCRVIKIEPELECMRRAAKVNDEAFLRVMKAIRPGAFEYEMKAVFTKVQYENGLLQDAYNGIFAGGVNSAILHYVENTDRINDGDLFLMDAGFEYKGYASDYTRTFPANGKFTEIQAGVYNAVLGGMQTVLAAIKPGVKMEELHLLAARTMMEGLRSLDIVHGSTDDLMENNIFALFFPHGLGHFLGLDTHDVGGYPKGVERIDRPGIKYLRARRDLEPGMVITVEPGLYFIEALLKPALSNPETKEFLNAAKIEPLLKFGGIRIEDNVAVTETGHENLTNVPKTVEDIEELMAGN